MGPARTGRIRSSSASTVRARAPLVSPSSMASSSSAGPGRGRDPLRARSSSTRTPRPICVDDSATAGKADRLASGRAVAAPDVVGARHRQRAARRAAGPPGRRAGDGRTARAVRRPATDGFVDVGAAIDARDLAARLAEEGVTLADGQRAEICLAIDAWMAAAAAGTRPRAPPPHRLRLPRRRALRPDRAPRRHAARVPPAIASTTSPTATSGARTSPPTSMSPRWNELRPPRA